MTDNQPAPCNDGDVEKSKSRHSAPHIVIVDDDDSVRLSIEMMLKHLGCEVISLISGESLLQSTVQLRDDSIIYLDQNMRGMSGTETYTELRSQRINNRIYFLTGSLNSTDIQSILRSDPACQSLQKPISLRMLQSTIDVAAN